MKAPSRNAAGRQGKGRPCPREEHDDTGAASPLRGHAEGALLRAMDALSRKNSGTPPAPFPCIAGRPAKLREKRSPDAVSPCSDPPVHVPPVPCQRLADIPLRTALVPPSPQPQASRPAAGQPSHTPCRSGSLAPRPSPPAPVPRPALPQKFPFPRKHAPCFPVFSPLYGDRRALPKSPLPSASSSLS